MTTSNRREDKPVTAKQDQALDLFKDPTALFFLLFGGARSGKTHVIVRVMVHRLLCAAGARSLIARHRLLHAKQSVWKQTLLPMLEYMLFPYEYKINHSELYVTFLSNGSELWVGGFDSQERTEKILGTEYLDIYFNEVSQISYDATALGLTRLAQDVRGFRNLGFFDCNPPSPLHWAHRMFIEKINPGDHEPLESPELYRSMLMNPMDNAENLPEHYIDVTLEQLSAAKKRRMKYGEWVKPEGIILDKFDESCILKADKVPEIEEYDVAVDFGLNIAAILIGWSGDRCYVLDDYGAYNLTTAGLNEHIVSIWPEWAIAYCDPSGGERIQDVRNGTKANNAVEPGLDKLNELFEKKLLFVCEKATGFLNEVYDYRRDDVGRIIKENDHFIDAVRYGVFSRLAKPEWGVA